MAALVLSFGVVVGVGALWGRDVEERSQAAEVPTSSAPSPLLSAPPIGSPPASPAEPANTSPAAPYDSAGPGAGQIRVTVRPEGADGQALDYTVETGTAAGAVLDYTMEVEILPAQFNGGKPAFCVRVEDGQPTDPSGWRAELRDDDTFYCRDDFSTESSLTFVGDW